MQKYDNNHFHSYNLSTRDTQEEINPILNRSYIDTLFIAHWTGAKNTMNRFLLTAARNSCQLFAKKIHS